MAALLRTLISRLLVFMFPSHYGPDKKYLPEDHYMRGPGPKWRAKHSSDRTHIG